MPSSLALRFVALGLAAPASAQVGERREPEVVVTASTLDLLGRADTASEGSITRQELEQRPVYRVGQLLETVPGLTVTTHSGEGKANQYLLRGFNLDHGTDLATYVDGMPVNMRTHAHGQGYTDLNFLIPELGAGLDFSKGPYFAAEGAQNDHRAVFGGTVSAVRDVVVGGIDQTLAVGVQTRHDAIRVDLSQTRRRLMLQSIRDDRVREWGLAGYVEDTIRPTAWLRAVLGVRGDWFRVSDRADVGGLDGVERAAVLQPKARLALRPWGRTEFYVSAGQGFHSNDGRAGTTDGGNSDQLIRSQLLARSLGYEAGVRASALRHLTAALAVFHIDFASELTYNADVGATEAGRPSRRTGAELTAQYRPWPWLELNTNLAVTHARFRDGDPAGRHIPDAPAFVSSAGGIVDGLGRWFGAVAFRQLGPHPLVENNSVRSRGYREVNANIGYKLTSRLRARLDVFNLTDSHDDAADYFYTARLPGEPAEGFDGIQTHPLEPRSARLTLTAEL